MNKGFRINFEISAMKLNEYDTIAKSETGVEIPVMDFQTIEDLAKILVPALTILLHTDYQERSMNESKKESTVEQNIGPKG